MPLYIVATPLGNLKDITFRALETLKSVDLILAEDTRRTGHLLSHYSVSKKIDSFHEHTSSHKLKKVVELLQEGKSIALVSDAGTPGICDPGAKLIREARKLVPNLAITPVPGPSAVTAVLSISGFPAHEFTFLGFPPKKGKKRDSFFREISSSKKTIVFFSTPHGIQQDLDALELVGIGTRSICISREATKVFESYYFGAIHEIIPVIKKSPQKGEYTIAISA